MVLLEPKGWQAFMPNHSIQLNHGKKQQTTKIPVI
jgi:hypothetical protein